MTREEAIKLAGALHQKATHLQHVTHRLRAYLDDPKMIKQWGVGHLMDAPLNRISLASAEVNDFVMNAISKLRIDPPGRDFRNGPAVAPGVRGLSVSVPLQ